MAIRAGSQLREEARHWLPSQGVDPAPLAELNAEFLSLLVGRATDAEAAVTLPPLLADLRGVLLATSLADELQHQRQRRGPLGKRRREDAVDGLL